MSRPVHRKPVGSGVDPNLPREFVVNPLRDSPRVHRDNPYHALSNPPADRLTATVAPAKIPSRDERWTTPEEQNDSMFQDSNDFSIQTTPDRVPYPNRRQYSQNSQFSSEPQRTDSERVLDNYEDSIDSNSYAPQYGQSSTSLMSQPVMPGESTPWQSSTSVIYDKDDPSASSSAFFQYQDGQATYPPMPPPPKEYDRNYPVYEPEPDYVTPAPESPEDPPAQLQPPIQTTERAPSPSVQDQAALGIGTGCEYIRRRREAAGVANTSKVPRSLPIGIKTTPVNATFTAPPAFVRKAMDIRYAHLPRRMLASEIDDDDGDVPTTPQDLHASVHTNDFDDTPGEYNRRDSSDLDSVCEDVGKIKLFVANPDN